VGDQVAEQEQGDPKDRMERRWLLRDKTCTIKRKEGQNKRAKTGVQWGSDLDRIVSLGAGSPDRFSSFPFWEHCLREGLPFPENFEGVC